MHTYLCRLSELVLARVLLTDGQARHASQDAPVDARGYIGLDGAAHAQLDQQRRAAVLVVVVILREARKQQRRPRRAGV